MKKTITINEFCEELKMRIEDGKTLDCCAEEIVKLAEMAQKHMGDKQVEVSWQEA